jgi:gamma-glutamyl hydrolase
VVPILYDDDFDSVKEAIAKLNGVLLMGGSEQTDEYYAFAESVYDYVVELNDAGNAVALWGTCLGFQYLGKFSATSNSTLMSSRPAVSTSLPLYFSVDPSETEMFSSLGDDAYDLEDNSYTYHSHYYGIKPEKFTTDSGLASMFKATSYCYDTNGNTFVNTMEAYSYPFYGIQFHPEISSAYSDDLMEYYNDYLAEFFIAKAALNGNSYGTDSELNADLITNYSYYSVSGVSAYAF